MKWIKKTYLQCIPLHFGVWLSFHCFFWLYCVTAVTPPDLGVGLMVQPSYIASLVMEMEHKTENNPAYNITYKLYVFTVNLFGFASFFGVLFLSFDRFLAVYLHLRYQELVTHKRVVVVTVSKWLFSAVLSFMRLCIPTRVSFIIYAVIYLSFLLTTTPINYKL